MEQAKEHQAKETHMFASLAAKVRTFMDDSDKVLLIASVLFLIACVVVVGLAITGHITFEDCEGGYRWGYGTLPTGKYGYGYTYGCK